jgi:hypothetical protein
MQTSRKLIGLQNLGVWYVYVYKTNKQLHDGEETMEQTKRTKNVCMEPFIWEANIQTNKQLAIKRRQYCVSQHVVREPTNIKRERQEKSVYGALSKLRLIWQSSEFFCGWFLL